MTPEPRSFDPGQLIERLDGILSEADGSVRHARLAELLEEVRAEDVAECLAHFTPEQKLEIFDLIPEEQLPEVIDETDVESTREILAHLDPVRLGSIIERMPVDEATDLVAELEEEAQEAVLGQLEPETAGEVRKLMVHHPESAGGIMTSDFITVRPERTADEVLEHLQGTIDSEVVSYVYVTDPKERLVGCFSIRELLKAAPTEAVESFMTRELIQAEVDEDQEKVATLARKYNLNSIPVVEGGVLVGVATIDDILDVLAEEADEDIYRLAGTAASHPAQQRVWRRAAVRIPWLLMPVVSGFIIAGMHARSGVDPESARAVGEVLTLAAFIPLVMGISGAVGTQTAIMMVRGMATGDIEKGRGGKVFAQELWIGLLIAVAIGGAVTGVLSLLLGIGALSGATALAPAVGLGLAGGIILASIFGTLFPIGCTAIGLDPALVAGPFITSLNDVVAAATYLGVARLVLTTLGGA